MKIYKITEASEYLGVSINTLKTLANNGKVKSFKTSGEHRRFRQDDLDTYMGVEKEKQEKLTVIYARCSRLRNWIMPEIISDFTGKPTPRILAKTQKRCDDCGTELINDCWVCGAPVCCPKCCMEAITQMESTNANT